MPLILGMLAQTFELFIFRTATITGTSTTTADGDIAYTVMSTEDLTFMSTEDDNVMEIG